MPSLSNYDIILNRKDAENILRSGVSTWCMEFGLIWCSHGHYGCDFRFTLSLIVLGSPGLVWFIRIIWRWNDSWFEGRDVTRIEFPLPPVISQVAELIPVAMMVGNCSEAKRCAYCHEEFDHDSARRFCASCGSAAHDECAVLNARCSVYGCAGEVGSLLTRLPLHDVRQVCR